MSEIPRRALAVTVFVALLLPGAAGARILDTTRSARPGHVSLAVEGMFSLDDPNPIWLGLHERIGLANGLDLTLDQRFGLKDDPGVRLGGAVKWTILSDARGRPGLGLWGGGFYDTGDDAAGLTASFMVDNTWGRFTPYAALDFDLWFLDDIDARFGLLAGVRVGVVKHLDFFAEGGVGLTGTRKNHFLSTGIRLSF